MTAPGRNRLRDAYCVTFFGDWEEPSGESRFRDCASRSVRDERTHVCAGLWSPARSDTIPLRCRAVLVPLNDRASTLKCRLHDLVLFPLLIASLIVNVGQDQFRYLFSRQQGTPRCLLQHLDRCDFLEGVLKFPTCCGLVTDRHNTFTGELSRLRVSFTRNTSCPARTKRTAGLTVAVLRNPIGQALGLADAAWPVSIALPLSRCCRLSRPVVGVHQENSYPPT